MAPDFSHDHRNSHGHPDARTSTSSTPAIPFNNTASPATPAPITPERTTPVVTTPPVGAHTPIAPVPAKPGDAVALLSPAWAAPGYFPHIHEQAIRRLEEHLGITIVEYPTTRKLNASPEERAADLQSAMSDPEIRAIFTSVGGDDEIQVIPHLDPAAIQTDPKPVFGYSDNTNLLNWLWCNGVGSYHGGATMVHWGAAGDPAPEHLTTLRAALFGEGPIELPLPTISQDFGLDWSDPRALTAQSTYEPALGLEFYGTSDNPVRGITWGGCLEALDQLAWAGRLPQPEDLAGTILILETSEIIPPPDYVGRWIRALGERGYLESAKALLFARPVVANRDAPAAPEVLHARREAYTDYLLANIAHYRNDLLVGINLPFGHTKPQLILPYGGEITINPARECVIAHYPTRENA
ncbi:muramoyltetrapeptide carboxypeptidase LdcA involved in peptidoglycan recycling [Arcanobacterium pluranimalium]|uniref:S66 family peptidase n=1 Tax=Arcanobacterium pluranimalium TaxID=108028 RepID=UPI00195A691C|nr:S66 peptidase family protein [Arcanobacterium pluranimalium]MBM7824693.1 muramoyltetrapeptide carboxypeptidase LdcA involved in peptidoglycan recycling [Arcanobacterium pluranimalium]